MEKKMNRRLVEQNIYLIQNRKVLLAEQLSLLEKHYDHQFKVVFDAIREIMDPIQPPKKRRIGFGAGE